MEELVRQNDWIDDAVDFCRDFDDQEDDERGRAVVDGALIERDQRNRKPALRVIKRHGEIVREYE